MAPVHRCARSVCFVVCAVSWATRLFFTCVPARCVVLRVQSPGQFGPCSPVCPLDLLCCVIGVPGHMAGSPVCMLRVSCCVCRFLGHLAPVYQCARSACCVACAASWATWLVFTAEHARRIVFPVRRPEASWLLFTGVVARCVVLRVRRPGPLGSCSLVCPLGALCSVCGVLGHFAPIHRRARLACCVACAVSWATWLLLTDEPARRVVLRVPRPGPLGSC